MIHWYALYRCFPHSYLLPIYTFNYPITFHSVSLNNAQNQEYKTLINENISEAFVLSELHQHERLLKSILVTELDNQGKSNTKCKEKKLTLCIPVLHIWFTNVKQHIMIPKSTLVFAHEQFTMSNL